MSVTAHVGDLSQAVWVAHDGSAVAWVSVDTQGHAPSKRFHHTTALFDGELHFPGEQPLLQAVVLPFPPLACSILVAT